METINGLEIGSVTLVGYMEDTFPVSHGNCFSLLADDNKYYRILNFNHENFEECIRRGVEYPIKIHVLQEGCAVIHDERIPHNWYDNHFCEVCTPYELWPFPQKLRRNRRIKSGNLKVMGISESRTIPEEFEHFPETHAKKGPLGYTFGPYTELTLGEKDEDIK